MAAADLRRRQQRLRRGRMPRGLHSFSRFPPGAAVFCAASTGIAPLASVAIIQPRPGQANRSKTSDCSQEAGVL